MQWFLLGNLKKIQWSMPEVAHHWRGFVIRAFSLGNSTNCSGIENQTVEVVYFSKITPILKKKIQNRGNFISVRKFCLVSSLGAFSIASPCK